MCELSFEGLPGVENRFISDISNEEFDEKKIGIIILHSWNIPVFEIRRLKKLGFKIVWYVWGSDMYRLGKFYNKALDFKGRYIRVKIAFKKGVVHGGKVLLKTFFPFLIDLNLIGIQGNVLSVFDSLWFHTESEQQMFFKKYTCRDTRVINYVNPKLKGPLNSIFPDIGDSLLVGNSSSIENLHFSLLREMSKLNLRKKVFVPLSYGDEKYKLLLESWLLKKKLKNIEVIRDFLSFDDYQNLIVSCGFMVMNHKRQQALGNVIQAIYSGLKVFLNPLSPLYMDLRNKGFYIFSSRELYNLVPLDLNQKIHNRNLLYKFFGKEVVSLQLNAALYFLKCNDKVTMN